VGDGFSDHLEIKVNATPLLNVLFSEVGLMGSDFLALGPTQLFPCHPLAASRLLVQDTSAFRSVKMRRTLGILEQAGKAKQARSHLLAIIQAGNEDSTEFCSTSRYVIAKAT
jgi:hypothetical protein